jgi:hypothetical protein
MTRWLIAISLAANQLVNALTGGSPGETVSSRSGRARAHGAKFGRVVCRALEAVDVHQERPGEDHCDKAVRHYRERLAEATR